MGMAWQAWGRLAERVRIINGETFMTVPVERCDLASDFSISRILTGLWQIADMERDGHDLDLKETASTMAPYVEAGFTTFDMADHGISIRSSKM